MKYYTMNNIENFPAYLKEKIDLYNHQYGENNYDLILDKCESGVLDITVYSANHMTVTKVFHASVIHTSDGTVVDGKTVDGELLNSKTFSGRLYRKVYRVATLISIVFLLCFIPYGLTDFKNWILPLVVLLIIFLLLIIYVVKAQKRDKIETEKLNANLDVFMMNHMGFQKGK